MKTMHNEGIVSALEGIVYAFNDEIVPFAYDLTVHLTMQFFKYS